MKKIIDKGFTFEIPKIMHLKAISYDEESLKKAKEEGYNPIYHFSPYHVLVFLPYRTMSCQEATAHIIAFLLRAFVGAGSITLKDDDNESFQFIEVQISDDEPLIRLLKKIPEENIKNGTSVMSCPGCGKNHLNDDEEHEHDETEGDEDNEKSPLTSLKEMLDSPELFKKKLLKKLDMTYFSGERLNVENINKKIEGMLNFPEGFISKMFPDLVAEFVKENEEAKADKSKDDNFSVDYKVISNNEHIENFIDSCRKAKSDGYKFFYNFDNGDVLLFKPSKPNIDPARLMLHNAVVLVTVATALGATDNDDFNNGRSLNLEGVPVTKSLIKSIKESLYSELATTH